MCLQFKIYVAPTNIISSSSSSSSKVDAQWRWWWWWWWWKTESQWQRRVDNATKTRAANQRKLPFLYFMLLLLVLFIPRVNQVFHVVSFVCSKPSSPFPIIAFYAEWKWIAVKRTFNKFTQLCEIQKLYRSFSSRAHTHRIRIINGEFVWVVVWLVRRHALPQKVILRCLQSKHRRAHIPLQIHSFQSTSFDFTCKTFGEVIINNIVWNSNNCQTPNHSLYCSRVSVDKRANYRQQQ